MTRSRRSVLRTCGATVGAGALGSLAGCSSLPIGNDGSPEDASSDSASGGSRWYQSRLPAPGELGYDHYSFEYTAVADLWNHLDETGIEEPDTASLPGFSIEEIDHALTVAGDVIGGPAIIYTEGDFDPTELAQRGADRRGHTEQGTTNGYTLWGAGSQASRAIGVKQGSMVQGLDSEGDPLEVVRLGIDTADGAAPTYQSTDEACASLVEALGGGTTVAGQRHASRDDLGGAVGEGVTLTMDGSETTISVSFVFEGASDVSPGAVAEWASSSWAFDEVAAEAVETSGSVATLERSLATSTVTEGSIDLPEGNESGPGGDTATPTPTASFGFEYERVERSETAAPDGTLTITHTGGDLVKRERLWLRGEGVSHADDVDQVGTGPWQGDASETIDGEPAVGAGDAVTVAVRTDYVVRVVHENLTDPGGVDLATDRGPEA